MKSPGSSKMNEQCCAFMKVIIEKATQRVEVQHSLTHIGHDMNYYHLQMSKDLRTSIVGTLEQTIPIKAILDETCDNVCSILN